MGIKPKNSIIELNRNEIELIKESLIIRIDYLTRLKELKKTGIKDLDLMISHAKESIKKHIDEINYILSTKLA